jgi:uncharacterized protein YvpB
MEKIITFFNFEVSFLLYFLVIAVFGCVNIYLIRLKLYTNNKSKIIFVIIIQFLLILIGVYGLIVTIKTDPKVITSNPLPHKVLNSFSKPIEIEFSAPVDYRKLTIYINPKVPLTKQYEKYFSILPYGRKIEIQPNISIMPNQKIMIYFSNISSPLSNKFGSEYLLELFSPLSPQVIKVEPENQNQDINPDTSISYTLSDLVGPFVSWDAEVIPNQKFLLKSESKKITINFEKPLIQGSDYQVKLYQTPVIYEIKSGKILETGEKLLINTIKFSTTKAPFVSDFEPTGDHVIPNQPIKILFDKPMNPDSVMSNISISPQTTGDYTWSQEETELTFHPANLNKNTDYTVLIKSGVLSKTGGKLTQDLTYHFKTLGPVKVTYSYPIDTNTNVSINTPISVKFDQEVSSISAQNKFITNPEIKGSFTWNNNTMIFKPALPLDYSSNYSYKITTGIISINGQNSTDENTYKFTTAPNEFVLKVPMYMQNQLNTCNIAVARMLLAYRGINISEDDLINQIGTSGSRGTGNPHIGFVPDYGTYWEPIVKAVTKYRRNRLFTNWNLKDLLNEINHGNPVMIWGQNGWSDPHDISWTLPDLTYIRAINGMHSSAVIGFRGPSDNPTDIIINDPWRGYSTIPLAEFTRRWSYFKTALIID